MSNKKWILKPLFDYFTDSTYFNVLPLCQQGNQIPWGPNQMEALTSKFFLEILLKLFRDTCIILNSKVMPPVMVNFSFHAFVLHILSFFPIYTCAYVLI